MLIRPVLNQLVFFIGHRPLTGN